MAKICPKRAYRLAVDLGIEFCCQKAKDNPSLKDKHDRQNMAAIAQIAGYVNRKSGATCDNFYEYLYRKKKKEKW